MSAFIRTLLFNDLDFAAAPLAVADENGISLQAFSRTFGHEQYELALPGVGAHMLQVGLSDGRAAEGQNVVFSVYDPGYTLVARRAVPVSCLFQAEGNGQGDVAPRSVRIGSGTILRETIGGWFRLAQNDLLHVLAMALRAAILQEPLKPKNMPKKIPALPAAFMIHAAARPAPAFAIRTA